MIENYIRQALEICLTMKKNDVLLVITDNETEYLGQKFFSIGQSIAPDKKHIYIKMEDLGPRGGSEPLKLPENMKEILSEVDISLYAAQGKKGELASFRVPFLKMITLSGTIKHGHMPGLSEDILRYGFGEDYSRVVELTNNVYELVKNARSAHVETVLGTDLDVIFNPDYLWIPSDAIIQPGQYGNIPSGEVFTCVETCSGKVVIDGEVGDYLCAKYGILDDTPLEINIQNGRATNISCKNRELVNDIEEYFKIDENANRVGEFAIGTNINLKKFIGNLLLDEKYPGMHIAFGSGYPDKTGANWDGKAHLDCIITKPTITIDGSKIMDKGNWVID